MNTTTLITPENGAKVPVLTDNQRAFLEIPIEQQLEALKVESDQQIDWLHPVRSKRVDCSFAGTVTFTFRAEVQAGVDKVVREKAHFQLSEHGDFRDAYTEVTTENVVSISNLKMNTTYYWKVNDSEVYSFTTEDNVPRWITVDGLTNVRDIGAWKTMDGHRVRQGLIYRGSEMDTHHTITPEGIRTMRGELGIRTDLDVRIEAVDKVTVSPIGEDIKFFLVPAAAYEKFMEQTSEKKETVRRLFEILADKQNYPIYLHCWGGADRTGTITFLINAILGVTGEDLILDYELTTLSYWGPRHRRNNVFPAFLEELEKYEGVNYNEKAESFLRCCGVDDELLNKLRCNLLQ